MPLFVATSTVQDGNMSRRTADPEEAMGNVANWLSAHGMAIEKAVRVQVSYDDGDDFCRYRIVDESNNLDGMYDDNDERADALVTKTVGQVLFLPVADCVAATIFDEKHGVLMLSHLGRHSLEQSGGEKSVQFLIDNFQTNPSQLKVWLSPAPGKNSYPIFKLNNIGMKEAVFDQLQRAGVRTENITDNPADTATDDNYFSHSAYLKGEKAVDGRFAMAAMISS